MLSPYFTTKFRRDYKRAKKQRRDIPRLEEALRLLVREAPLPESFRDHALSGNFRGYRECHIEPDWLLLYRVDNEHLVLVATRLGSHSELLGL